MDAQQTKENRAEELMDLQGRLARRFLFARHSGRAGDISLARQEARVLISLGRDEIIRMGELAQRLSVSVSSLTAVIDRLVAKGLTERRRAAEDRRVVLVALTPDGRRHHEDRRQARLRMSTAMLNALPPREQKRFLALMRKIVSSAAAGTLILLASLPGFGCASVRHARAVQDPANAGPGERPAAAADLGIPPSGALTLDRVIALAISNSPAVLQARAALAASDARLREARASFLPQLTGSSAYRRAKDTRGVSTESSDSYSAGLSLGQDLFSFGRNEAALRGARAQREASEEQLRSAILSAAYSARIACFDLIRAQDLLAVAVENVREFDAHLDQVRSMAELGTRIRYDITKAEVDLGNARISALTASNTLALARAALGRTLGLVEELPCSIVAPPQPLPVTEDRDALFLRARRNNPDLIALRAQVCAASAAVDFAVADLRPDLTFNTGLSWSGAGFPLGWGWSFGPSIDASLFDGWRKTSVLDAAAAELRASRARVADREQQLFQDLTAALAQFRTACAQSGVAEVVVRSARESLTLATARYRLGLATAVELTDAEVAVAQARTQQVQARRDEAAAQALILLHAGDL